MYPTKESGVVLDNTPLLQNAQIMEHECENVVVRPTIVNSAGSPASEVVSDLWSIGKIVIPIAMATLLQHMKSLISMLFLGRLGSVELAGGALALSFANVTGFSVIKGVNLGTAPICSQAYGSKRYIVISHTFQRTILLLLVTAIAIAALWLNMESILLLLGQDEAIIKVAKFYLIFSIPELGAQVLLNPLRSFLRTQSITKPFTIGTAICLVLHMPINYIFVYFLDLGVKGVALATACNTICLNVGMLIYVRYSDAVITKPWTGLLFTLRHLLTGWGRLLPLAVSSVLSVCLEWWWYEIMLFLCGLLHNPEDSVAAMGILIQTTGLLYVFPHALNMGLSTLVGQELGALRPDRAQRLTVVGMTSAFILGTIALVFTYVVRSAWGKMYTSDAKILALVIAALPVLGVCELGNCPQTAATGVLTGSARTGLGAKINFFAFYIVGLPVAILTTFKMKVGFMGLWYALGAAQVTCALLAVGSLFRTDWTQQAMRSEDLMRGAEDCQDTTNDLETGLLS